MGGKRKPLFSHDRLVFELAQQSVRAAVSDAPPAQPAETSSETSHKAAQPIFLSSLMSSMTPVSEQNTADTAPASSQAAALPVSSAPGLNCPAALQASVPLPAASVHLPPGTTPQPVPGQAAHQNEAATRITGASTQTSTEQASAAQQPSGGVSGGTEVASAQQAGRAAARAVAAAATAQATPAAAAATAAVDPLGAGDAAPAHPAGKSAAPAAAAAAPAQALTQEEYAKAVKVALAWTPPERPAEALPRGNLPQKRRADEAEDDSSPERHTEKRRCR